MPNKSLCHPRETIETIQSGAGGKKRNRTAHQCVQSKPNWRELKHETITTWYYSSVAQLIPLSTCLPKGGTFCPFLFKMVTVVSCYGLRFGALFLVWKLCISFENMFWPVTAFCSLSTLFAFSRQILSNVLLFIYLQIRRTVLSKTSCLLVFFM